MRHLEGENDIVRSKFMFLGRLRDIIDGGAFALPPYIEPGVIGLFSCSWTFLVIALGGQELIAVVGSRSKDGAHQEAENLAEHQDCSHHRQLPAGHVLNDGSRHPDLKQEDLCEKWRDVETLIAWSQQADVITVPNGNGVGVKKCQLNI